MFCEKCGVQLLDGARFCQECGAAVLSDEPEYAQPEYTRPEYTRPDYSRPDYGQPDNATTEKSAPPPQEPPGYEQPRPAPEQQSVNPQPPVPGPNGQYTFVQPAGQSVPAASTPDYGKKPKKQGMSAGAIVGIVVGAVAVVAAVLVLVIVLMTGSNDAAARLEREDGAVAETPVQADATPEPVTDNALNYEQYEGAWVSDGLNNMDDMWEHGGYYVYIEEIEDDSAVVVIDKVDDDGDYGYLRTRATLEDGVGTFVFYDDLWANEGEGTIELLPDGIRLDIVITRPNEDAWFDIGGSATLHRADDEYEYEDYYEDDYDVEYDLSWEEILDQLVLEGQWRYYSYDELIWMDEYDLSILRNGLFALSGKEFVRNEEVRDFFENHTSGWYYPDTTDDDVVMERMNEYQRANLELIIDIEREKGYRE